MANDTTDADMAARTDTKRRLTLVLMPALITFSMGQTVLFAVAGPAFREAGLSESQLGQIVSAAAIVFVFSSTIWGRIADNWGRRPTVLLGLWSYGLISLAFAAVLGAGLSGALAAGTVFVSLLLLRLFYAALGGGIQPASVALMADISSAEERSASVAVVGAAFGIGMILGPAAAAALVGFGVLTPLYAIAVLGLITALLATVALPGVTPRIEEQLSTPPSVRSLLPALISMLMLYLAVSALQQTLAFKVQDQLQLNAQDTARLTGFCFMAIAFTTLLMQGGVIQRFKPTPRTLLLIGLPLAVCAFAGFGLATTLSHLLLASALMGLGFGLATPGLTAAASLMTDAQSQGRTAGLMQAMMSLGYVFGPITSTMLYEQDPAYSTLLATSAAALGLLVLAPKLLSPGALRTSDTRASPA